MASTSIYWDGRVIRTPGSYSRVDASGLEGVGLTASGIVAVLGTAEGGVPMSAISEFADIPRFNTAEKMKATFRSGQLLEVADMLFAPAKDPDILGGAQEVLACKCNPSTQSVASLTLSTVPQVDLTSRDYGALPISVDLQTGTTKGKHLTIAYEDATETVDDLGGDAVFTLQYVPGSYGYNGTALAAINAAGNLSVVATRTQAVVAATDAPANAALNAACELVGTNQTGTVTTLGAPVAGIQTATGLSGLTATHVGRTLTISGATNPSNNGSFTILTQTTGGTVATYSNVGGLSEGAVATWTVSDAGILVTVYGLVSSLPVKEVMVHNGTSVVTGTTVWDVDGVRAVVLDKAPVAGAVVVRRLTAGLTIYSIATGAISKGAIVCEDCYVATGAVTVKLSDTGTPDVLVFGRDTAGSALANKVTLSGVTPVASASTSWSRVDAVVVSAVADGKTVTLTATAASTLGATTHDKLSKLETYFGALQRHSGSSTYGFVFAYGTGNTSFLMADMDIAANVNVLYTATGSFKADLYALVAWINENSALVSAVESTGATAVPDNTASPLYLGGGIDGTASFADYQAALNLLKRGRVNSVDDLSGDPAVAAAIDAHCAYMGGIGRSERDGFVGALNAAKTGLPSKTEFKAQALNLNSRHMRVWGQTITRYNSAGESADFLPPYGAAILAGAQAGSPVGTSLTHKYLNVLGLKQASTWNPTDDSEEMIAAGVVFAENVDGVGRRVVRNVTTHLSSNNIAFTEGSVNQAVNFAVFSFRTAMEFAVGKRGFASTLAAARGVAVGTLGLLVDNVGITKYRSLFLELVVDVMDVSVEIAPIIPINFVRTTAHLVTIAQAA